MAAAKVTTKVLGKHGSAVAAVVAFAVLVRLALIAQGWPYLNSDEGTMGLMAMHIAEHGERPIFEYGQSYMGATEAYLAAALFHVFGPSLVLLRLPLAFLFGLFLVGMYFLSSLLYSKKVALLTLIVLSLGGAGMLFRQLQAVGGFQEALVFTVVMVSLASWLALHPQPAVSPGRLAAYAAYGLTAGLALWSDPLVAPSVGTSALLLWLFCKELGVQTTSWLCVGLIAGLSPLIVYTMTSPGQPSTLVDLVHRYHAAGLGQGGLLAPLQGIMGVLLVSLPFQSGGMSVCALATLDVWPVSGHAGSHVITCTVVHAVWGLGVVMLWAAASVGALTALRRHGFRLAMSRWSPADRRSATLHAARLALLVSAGLSVVMYIASGAPAQDPSGSSRYLSAIWIAVPAVLEPIAGVFLITGVPRRAAFVGRSLAGGALACLLAALMMGTVAAFQTAPGVRAQTRAEDALIENLVRMHATHVYADYWTCNRITFQSGERVICSVLDEHLRPGWNRYPPYRLIVRRDRRAAYVFPAGSTQASAFAWKFAHQKALYRHTTVAGYIIYQPLVRST